MSSEEEEVSPEIITVLTRKAEREVKRIGKRVAALLRGRDAVREALLERGDEIGAKIVTLGNELGKEIVTYAIDSSFKAPIPLVIGDLFLVISGYVRYPRHSSSKVEVNRGIDVFVRSRGELPSRVQSAIAKIKERRLSLKILRGDFPKWNTIIFDGPLFPLWPLLLEIKTLRYKAEEKLINITNRVFKLAKKRRKSLIGIIKRVRSHIIAKGLVPLLEKQGVSVPKIFGKMNDKVLGAVLLNPGEALILGGYKPEEPPYVEILELGKKGRFEELSEEYPWILDINMVLIKPFRSRQPIKVEIADYADLGTENILNWLNMNSSHTGCPYVLDIVDRYVNLTYGVIEVARKLLLRGAAKEAEKILKKIAKKKIYEELDVLLEFADLQKKFIPKMG